MPYIGKSPVAGGFHKLDNLTASATDTYALTLGSAAYYPETANQLLVSLNGVIQAPQDSFTVSGSNLIFDSALTTSDSIDFVVALGDVIGVGSVTDGAITTAKLGNNAVTSAKLDTNIDIAGTLDVTGALTADSGIYLGGTGSANYLTDYEEGTWTPVAEGETTAGTGTYNYQVGSYVKVGSLVQIQASIQWTAHTGSGVFKLTGLPFASKSTTNLFSSFSAYIEGLPITTNFRAMPFMVYNTSHIYINQASGSGGPSSVNIDNAAQVLLTGTYRA